MIPLGDACSGMAHGGGHSSVLDANYPPTNHWPEAGLGALVGVGGLGGAI